MKETLIDDSMIRVGVVDDHLIFTIPFADMLNQLNGIRATLTASSGRELLRLLNETTEKPHIILMDIRMKDMDGIEATKHVTILYPDIKVIALSGTDEEYYIRQMLEAGACAYLRKDIMPAALEEALCEVHRKGKYYADLYHLYEKELRVYKFSRKKVAVTEREMEVLRYMRKGYTNTRMAEVMFVSLGSIKYYKTQLSEKFETSSPVSIVLEAISRGLLSLQEPKEDK